MRQKSQTMPIIAVLIVVFVALVYAQYRYYTASGSIPTSKNDSIASHIVSGGPGKDSIPSIDTPVFESVASADAYLDNAGLGIAIDVQGKHRYYPFQILVWHEVVNDTFNGEPLAITFSPLTYTSNVFERKENMFGVSGNLYNSNTLLFDRASNSIWLQATGESVDGEKSGTKLVLYPSSVLSWSAFKQAYPLGTVLSTQTGFKRDYTHDPYDDYETNNAILFPLTHKDNRFHQKSIVYGIDVAGKQKAFFRDAIVDQKLVNDQVGSESVLVLSDKNLDTLKAFDRVINTQTLTFSLEDDVLVDKETGTRWNLNGEAFSGTLRGTHLSEIPLQLSYWFSWFAMHPETDVVTKN